MKKVFVTAAVLVFVMVSFISCNTKDEKPKSKLELLTQRTWIYDEYYRNYNSSSTNLIYKRGKANNPMNLDNNRVTFSGDGTYVEYNELGETINGTWHFLNNETEIQVMNPINTYTSSIKLLDEDHFNWLDPSNSNGTYGKMIH